MDFNVCTNVARWTARTLGLLYFIFIAWFVAAHVVEGGLPNIWQAPAAVRLDFLALLLMSIGGIVGWRWEGVAAVMLLFGGALWLLVEGHWPWPPGLTLLIGVLYAISWWCERQSFMPPRQAMQ